MVSRGAVSVLGKECVNIFTNLKCVLIDLSGTLHIGDTPIEGAVTSLQRLRDAGLKIRFVTNTTKESKNCLIRRLSRMGFTVSPDEMFTTLVVARQYIEKRFLRPFLIIDKDATEDFEGVNCENPNAVLVALAKSELNYENMNTAFRLIMSGAEFIAIHKGRYYRDGANLSLGPGPFVEGLQYSTGKEPLIIGKPSPAFFSGAVESTGCELGEAVMIGDDVRDDVGGAMTIGMRGILVKTGKYLPNDESKISPPPDLVTDNFGSAVDAILSSIKTRQS